MIKTLFDSIVPVAAVAAALAVSACAGAKPSAPAREATPAAAPAVSAAPTPQAPAPIAMPTVALTRVGGVVVSGDGAARTLTIKDYHGLTRTFRVAGDARFTKGGADSALVLAGIAAGDRIRLKVGGDVIASGHVMVKPAQ